MAPRSPWLPAPAPVPAAGQSPLFEPVGTTDQSWPVSAPARQGPRQKRSRRGLKAVLAGLLAVLAKLKTLLLLLPKLKLFTTAGTMVISVAAYSFVFGWPFAAGFVVLLLVHEMGHVIQLRREGVKASTPMFIPFLGAVISARTLGKNALAEARVGLAGQVLGSIGAAACIVVWQLTGSDIWRALAFTG